MSSAAKDLEKLARSTNGGDRVKAVEHLVDQARRGESDDATEAFKLLKLLSSDGKWEVRQALAEKATLLPDSWFWKLIPGLLDDANPFVKKAALRVKRLRSQSAGQKDDEKDERAMDRLASKIEAASSKNPNAFHKAVMTALRDAQGLAINEFAHELKNLLHPLNSQLSHLREDFSDHTLRKHSETLNRIAQRSKRLEDFSESMRFIAEGRKLHFDVIRCGSLVDQVCQAVQDLADEKGVSLIVREPPDVNLRVVIERMARALINIVKNAIEASPDGGRVEFSATLFDEAGEIEFVIRDNGPGIKEEYRRVIFSPFASGKKEQGPHLGMGLYLAYSVVELEHRGAIEVDSDGESWTVFRCRVPLGT